MAIFSTPFTTPGNYTYDNTKIEVTGGLAKLKENLTNVYGRWHLNESSGDTIPDDSGNGRNGTRVSAPSWVAGILNNCLSFDGLDDQASFADIAGFDRLDPFSIELWINTTDASGPTLVSKKGSSSSDPGYEIYLRSSGKVQIVLVNGAGNKIDVKTTTTTVHDGAWHHIIITYDGSGTATGVTCYIDGASRALTVNDDTLTAAITNTRDLKLGAVGTSSSLYTGLIDEFVVYDKELSLSEVTYRYASGVGREYWYPTDEPTIYKTAGDTDVIFSWDAFISTEGTVEGSLRYQLSSDEATWYYWDGGAWSVASPTNYNTSATVNTNISSFPTGPDKIYVKTFMLSNGDQQVEIDNIDINYTSNQAPIINAGTNKSCKDAQTIKPFSDSSFSDPDGSIDFCRYKIDNEVDLWTNIPVGGFASLLEAAQDFDYTFNNVDVIVARLQVEDNQGATAEDSLNVTVSQYTRTVNIRDSSTNNHIAAIEFDPGDGSGFATRNSPFSYSWDYGTFSLTLQASGYYSKTQSVLMNTEADLDLVLEPVSYVNECKASMGLIADSDTLVITSWLLKNGEIVTSPISCNISFKDRNGTVIYSDSSSSPGSDGVFKFEKTPSGLANEGVYRLEVSIVEGGTTYVTTVPTNKIQRDRFSLDGKVYIDPDNGFAGTIYPVGTFNKPSNNWADAKVIADSNLIKRFAVRGTLTLGPSDGIGGYEFSGDVSADVKIVLQGGSTDHTIIKHMIVTGQVNGHMIIMDHSHIDQLTNFEGEIYESGFVNADPVTCLTLTGSDSITIVGCWSEIPGMGTPIIDMGGSGRGLSLRSYSGGIKLINKTGTDSVTLEFIAGQAKLDSTVTAGTIVVRGARITEDNSGSNVIIQHSVTQDIYDDIHGKWVLDTDSDPMTLTKYRKLDGAIMMRFNLDTVSKNVQPIISRIPQ